MMKTVGWCNKCHRMIGIGCACDLSFAEKIKTVSIDKHSLTDDDRQWREYDRVTGQENRRRAWGKQRAEDAQRA